MYLSPKTKAECYILKGKVIQIDDEEWVEAKEESKSHRFVGNRDSSQVSSRHDILIDLIIILTN